MAKHASRLCASSKRRSSIRQPLLIVRDRLRCPSVGYTNSAAGRPLQSSPSEPWSAASNRWLFHLSTVAYFPSIDRPDAHRSKLTACRWPEHNRSDRIWSFAVRAGREPRRTTATSIQPATARPSSFPTNLAAPPSGTGPSARITSLGPCGSWRASWNNAYRSASRSPTLISVVPGQSFWTSATAR